MAQMTELTKEQEAQIEPMRDKWLEIAYRHGPSNKRETKKGIRKQYREADLKEPTYWVWCEGPLTAVYVAYMVEHQWAAICGNPIMPTGRDKRTRRFRDAAKLLRAQLKPQFKAKDVNTSRVKLELPDPELVKSELSNVCGGNWSAAWLGFCEFFRDVCDLKEDTEKMAGAIHAAKNCGWWWPFEDLVIVVDRPKVKVNSEHRLHCDGGPAMEYPDGWSIYFLNGVRVSQELAETPGEELDPNLVLKADNAEVRREIVRKIGIERLWQKLQVKTLDKASIEADYPIYKESEYRKPRTKGKKGKGIPGGLVDQQEKNLERVQGMVDKLQKEVDDRKETPAEERKRRKLVEMTGVTGSVPVGYEKRTHDYELGEIPIGGGRHARALKMLNPSIGIFHVEFVPENITTVKEALEWRWDGEVPGVIV